MGLTQTSRTLYLSCDHCDKMAQCVSLVEAFVEGWREVEGRWICPTCQKKPEESPNA